jgi:glycosyltransferase involved in cell wall biosynthesis
VTTAPARNGSPGGRPLRVATAITRLEGGAGAHALRGARTLDPRGYQVTVITGSGGRLVDEAAAAGLEVLVEPSLRAPIALRDDLRALGKLDALLRDRHFDVVHTHCAKAGAVGRLAARRAGVPRIVHTYHGFPFHEFQSAARRRAYIAIERRLGRFTDLALCVGSGVAVEAVRRRLLEPQRIRTIGVVIPESDRPAAGPPPAAHARRRARLALGLPPDAVVIGAVGRLTYQKAPEDFLAALRGLGRPGVAGVWIGGGELAGRVAALAAGGPGPRVLLAGERADVPGLLPAFDVFALPSRYEGLPTAIVEAMACGIPVVATAVNAVGDVVVPGETGLLVPPGRPDLMATALAYLLDSPADAARMAANAYATVRARYHEPALQHALVSAYAPAEPQPDSFPVSAH